MTKSFGSTLELENTDFGKNCVVPSKYVNSIPRIPLEFCKIPLFNPSFLTSNSIVSSVIARIFSIDKLVDEYLANYKKK